ncbi:MAG: hypothetical protein ACRDRU_04375 [Pseudonocardiaceae bacterium]
MSPAVAPRYSGRYLALGGRVQVLAVSVTEPKAQPVGVVVSGSARWALSPRDGPARLLAGDHPSPHRGAVRPCPRSLFWQ